MAAVLVDGTGTVLERIGPDVTTTWRSAAKPFQLEGSLSFLTSVNVENLTTRDLAIGAASHSGQPAHVDAVQDLQRRLGVPPTALECGGHLPLHADSARALNAPPDPVHNNCSGKHTFMVAAAMTTPDDLSSGLSYRDPEHPVQKRIRRLVADYAGHSTDALGIDGCGAPCFLLPISAMATAWARLATAFDDARSTLGRIGRAMNAEPFWMSGDGRLDHSLVAHATRPIVSKVGAQGLLCVALPHRRAGFCLKVRTGNDDARAVAARAQLRAWDPGLLPDDMPAPEDIVRNVVGHPVGRRVYSVGGT